MKMRMARRSLLDRIGAFALGIALAVGAFGWGSNTPPPAPAPAPEDSSFECKDCGYQSGGDETESAGCPVTGAADDGAPRRPARKNCAKSKGKRKGKTSQAVAGETFFEEGVSEMDLAVLEACPGTPMTRDTFDPTLLMLDILGDDRVVFADPLTGEFKATINLADGLPFQLTAPQSMAVTPDCRRLAVTNLGAGFQDEVTPPHISIIDIAARRILRRVMLPEGVGVYDSAASADSSYAYVGAANRTETPPFFASSRILVIDLELGGIVDEIALPDPPGRPGDMAITPDGRLLFVVGGVERARGRIFVIDTRTRSLSATAMPPDVQGAGDLRLDANARLAMHPDGSRVYVAPMRVLGEPTMALSALDTASLVFGEPILLGEVSNPARTGLAVSSHGRDLYFNDALGERFVQIDTITRGVLFDDTVGFGSFGPIYTITGPRGSLTLQE